jgi:translation elongation factor EF-1alpha
MEEKPTLNLITLGNLASGKSTLVGRLMYELGGVSEGSMAKIK